MESSIAVVVLLAISGAWLHGYHKGKHAARSYYRRMFGLED